MTPDDFITIPRASGGYPLVDGKPVYRVPYSPRKRGLSVMTLLLVGIATLFPAQAGVILGIRLLRVSRLSIPRASGGYPDSL